MVEVVTDQCWGSDGVVVVVVVEIDSDLSDGGSDGSGGN